MNNTQIEPKTIIQVHLMEDDNGQFAAIKLDREDGSCQLISPDLWAIQELSTGITIDMLESHPNMCSNAIDECNRISRL